MVNESNNVKNGLSVNKKEKTNLNERSSLNMGECEKFCVKEQPIR